MRWLDILQVLWPIAVIIIPLMLGAGFLWLKTQLATKAELKSLEADTDKQFRENAGRFERGSKKFSEHDKRLAIVERDCEEVPTRQTLQTELSQVAQRLRGVETGHQAIERQLGTANDYLKIIVDKGFKA